MKKYMCAIAGLLFLWGVGCSDEKISQAEVQAEKEAAVWLELVDQGQYEESWQQAATFFKSAVPQEKWIQSMQALRDPLGHNLSRNRKSTRYSTTLYGAPDGEYVVIKLESVFEDKASAQEMITLMLEADGKWRVAGYYLK
jgi:hypothetical protein